MARRRGAAPSLGVDVTRPAPRTVALLAAADTLEGVDDQLRRVGVRAVRLALFQERPRPVAAWTRRLPRRGPPDTVLVTSRRGVACGVVPWQRGRSERTRVEYWGIGTSTVDALRRAGVRRPRRPARPDSAALTVALRRPGGRAILYFRSREAGTALARSLRKEGHHVTDVVVYYLRRIPHLPRTARRSLDGAELVVATSPSALSALRSLWGSARFARWAGDRRLIVLGERSRRAALARGFRHVAVVPPSTAQRFTRHLLRELRDAVG